MTDDQKKKEAARLQSQKTPVKSNYPPWMHVEKVSFKEKLEIKLYEMISLFPVMVTFGLYVYMMIFYFTVTIYSSF